MRDIVLLRVLAPPQLPADVPPESLFENLLINAGKELGLGDIAVECVGYGQFVHILLAVPRSKKDILQSIIFASYPEADVQEVEEYVDTVPRGAFVAAARITLKRADVYPILTYDNTDMRNVPTLTPGAETEPVDRKPRKIAQLFTALASTELHDQLWFQMVIRYVPNNFWFHLRRTAKGRVDRLAHVFNLRDYLRTPGKETLDAMREKKAKEKGNMMPLLACIRCVSVSERSMEEARRRLHAVTGALTEFNHIDINDFAVTELRITRPFLREYRRRALTHAYFFTPREAATLAFVPDPATVPNVTRVLSRKLPPPQNLPEISQPDVSPLGYTNYHNILVPFGLPLADRRRNMTVVGESGVGKELALQRLILNDIEQGRGVAVVDAHGTLIEGILPFIPRERLGDVLLLDPSDPRCPVTFNPLEGVSPTVIVQFIQALATIGQGLLQNAWTAEAEQLLHYTFSALLSSQGATLLSAISLYKDPAERRRIAQGVQDALARNFWVSEFDQWSQLSPSAVAISTVLAKLGQLLSSPILRRILGRPHSSFSMEQMIGRGGILLWNVPQGYLGEQASMLLGSLFLTRLGLAVVERAHTARPLHDFFLYVDNFPSFVMGNMAEVLSGARQYPLNLVLAHQRVSELSEDLRKLVFGNVGTLLTFRVGKEEGGMLEDVFESACTAEDFVNLGLNEFFLRTEIDGKKYPPFSGRLMALPDKARVRKEDVAEAVRRNFPPVPQTRVHRDSTQPSQPGAAPQRKKQAVARRQEKFSTQPSPSHMR